MSGRWSLVVLLLFGAQVAAGPAPAVPGRDLPLQRTSRGTFGDSDLWRAVHDGAVGAVADPRSQSGRLITPVGKDCVKAGNCTERAVGFTLPVHQLMPPIQVPQGRGPEPATVAFVVLLFGGLLLAGAAFVRRLGRGREGS